MLPRITAELPGINCTRHWDAAIACEEVLRRRPEGGDFWWLKVRSNAVSPHRVALAIARAASIEIDHVAHAGPRERRAQCDHWFSVPKAEVEHPACFRNAGYQRRLKVLEVREGARPIGPREVLAMQWQLRFAGGSADEGYDRAKAILDSLRRTGCPNYILGQHSSAQLAKWGKLLAQGKDLPRRVREKGESPKRMLLVYRDQLFNTWIAQRIASDVFSAPLAGDVMEIGCNRPTWERDTMIVTDPESMRGRMDSWEAVPLGPLFGADMPESQDDARACELAACTEQGVKEQAFSRLAGARRALRFRPAELAVDIAGKDLTVQCQLPVSVRIAPLVEELLKPEGHLR